MLPRWLTCVPPLTNSSWRRGSSPLRAPPTRNLRSNIQRRRPLLNTRLSRTGPCIQSPAITISMGNTTHIINTSAQVSLPGQGPVQYIRLLHLGPEAEISASNQLRPGSNGKQVSCFICAQGFTHMHTWQHRTLDCCSLILIVSI